MTSEEQELLNQVLELSQQNNKMLHAMRREAWLAKIWGIIKLLMFIIPLIWAWFYLQPYIVKINELYNQVQSLEKTTTQGSQNIQNWFNNLTTFGSVKTNSTSSKINNK